MEVLQKKYEKPMIKFATDMNIILECLYEVYGQEEHHVLEGKDIRKTMIFPFLKMLESQCNGITVREIHKKLWKIYISERSKEPFISSAESLLKPVKREEENVNALQ